MQEEKPYIMPVPKELKGKKCNPIELDPKGYFLINIKGKTINIAHCDYQDKKGWYKNKVESTFSSENPDEILKWTKDNNFVSLDEHYQYLVKEMKKVVKAIESNTKYVQE